MLFRRKTKAVFMDYVKNGNKTVNYFTRTLCKKLGPKLQKKFYLNCICHRLKLIFLYGNNFNGNI